MVTKLWPAILTGLTLIAFAITTVLLTMGATLYFIEGVYWLGWFSWVMSLFTTIAFGYFILALRESFTETGNYHGK